MLSSAPHSHTPPPTPGAPTRRGFLGLAGAAGLGAAGLALPATAAGTAPGASASGAAAGALRFAVVTDTHSDVAVPQRMTDLRRMLEVAADDDPAFVFNCGDITEYGSADEYAGYRAAIPDRLTGRMRHVPGNHESRWDAYALEVYRKHFGSEWTSFVTGGVHMMGLGPVQLLQEPGLFGDAGLEWIAASLERHRSLPTLMFLHYPLGGRNYYVNDAAEFFDLIAGYPVRGIFAGHIHRHEVLTVNGLTQVAMRATKDGPSYQWVEQVDGDTGPVLRVTNVRVPATGDPVRTPVAEIPMTPPAEDAAVYGASVRADGGVAAVSCLSGPAAARVEAKIYPQHVYGGTHDAGWVSLAESGGSRWSGGVPLAGLAPGRHRLQIRATDPAGRTHETTDAFDVPGSPVDVTWTRDLGAPLQAALVTDHASGLVVAATTDGGVRGFEPHHRQPRQRWRTRIGRVYRAGAVVGSRVVVPSADHHVYALDLRTGRQVWRTDLGAPALSTVVRAQVDGLETILLTAGERLYRLTPAGEVVWSADLHGFFSGVLACDGDCVYTGGGDGNAYAFDARTGRELWSVSATTRTTPYTRLIYGPWNDVLELLPGDLVLIATVSGAMAVDRATGTIRWTRSGNAMYTPGTLTRHGLLLVEELGAAAMVDPATGVQRWKTQTVPRALEAGPVLTDPDTAWLIGTTGLLMRIDLASGTAVPVRQIASAYTYSTPALVRHARWEVLVYGSQDGVLRGVVLGR